MSHFIEYKYSWPCLEELSTDPYSEPNETVHKLPSHYIRNHSNAVIRRLGRSRSVIFSDHNFVGICRFSHALYKPGSFHPPWFYYRHLNKIWIKYKSQVFSFWTFVQPPVTSRFFIQTLFWTPCYQQQQSLFSSRERPRFTPWQISTQHTIFLCVYKYLRSRLYS